MDLFCLEPTEKLNFLFSVDRSIGLLVLILTAPEKQALF